MLKQALIAGAVEGRYKATALVYDVRVTLPSSGEKSDAVAVALDHRDDYSVVVLIPYKIRNGKAVFGGAFSQRGESDIFRRP
jgi:threonine synthase